MTSVEQIIFLSYPWGPSCPAYANGQRISLENASHMDHGDSCNSKTFKASNHIGTHFDFPKHFDPQGQTLSDYGAESFVHRHIALFWLNLEGRLLITPQDLKLHLPSVNPEATMVLIRSGCGMQRQTTSYWENGTGLDKGMADFLRTSFPNITTIGLDSISLTSLAHRDIGREVHKEFLAHKHPILIIEDMNLEILEGKLPKEITALPLRIEDGDGAPCTILARF